MDKVKSGRSGKLAPLSGNHHNDGPAALVAINFDIAPALRNQKADGEAVALLDKGQEFAVQPTGKARGMVLVLFGDGVEPRRLKLAFFTKHNWLAWLRMLKEGS